MSYGKSIKNLAASIRARLLNNSKQQGIDFNRMLLIYFQQCFLERLSQEKYTSYPLALVEFVDCLE